MRRAFGLRAFFPGVDVLVLLGRKGVDRHSESVQLEARDLTVDVKRHIVDVGIEVLGVLDHVFRGQRLICEAHVHHGRRMPVTRRKVDQPTLAQDEDLAAVGHEELIHEVAHLAVTDAHLFEPGEVDLNIEVTGVRNHRASLHDREVGLVYDMDVAGDGQEQVSLTGGLSDRKDTIALHDRLKCAGRIHIGHDHARAHAPGAHGDPASAPPKATHYDHLAGKQDVRGADNPIKGGLSRAVPVVKEMLGGRLVHRDDRELENVVLLHGLQADDTGRRLFRASDDRFEEFIPVLVDFGDQVTSIVHGDVWLGVQDLADVAEVGRLVFALDRVDRDAVFDDERGSGLILGRKGIRRARGHFRPAGLEGNQEIRGLGRDVKARAKTDSGERLLTFEAVTDQAQDWHVLRGPFDALLPAGGEGGVLDVMRNT